MIWSHALFCVCCESEPVQKLFATDTNPYTREHLMGEDFNYAHILKEYDVGFVDSNAPPFKQYDVPGGGCMFDRYTLSACFEGAEVVSVAKMKNHLFMGITLCMKNLFGLPPITLPHGRVRSYYHHFIRLSYVLPDLGLITQPCLNIVDALTGQWGREWGGQGRICNALLAGDHVTATDACGAHLMGHDPASDWPNPPFRRDRNHLLIAAKRGFGTVDLREIDFESEVSAPLAEFDSERTDSEKIVKAGVAPPVSKHCFTKTDGGISLTGIGMSLSFCKMAMWSGTVQTPPIWAVAGS